MKRQRSPRPRGFVVAVVTTAALFTFAGGRGGGPSVSASKVGLRGPLHQSKSHYAELRQSSQRMPQHGNQRPRRPANLPPHMLPPLPPGHDGHRRLTPEDSLTALGKYRESGVDEEMDGTSPRGRELADRGRDRANRGGGTKVPSNKGEVRLSDVERNNLNRPRREKKQTQEPQENAEQSVSGDRKEIKEENRRRKEENKKLKLMREEQNQQKPKRQQDTKKKEMEQQKMQQQTKKYEDKQSQQGGKKGKDKDKKDGADKKGKGNGKEDNEAGDDINYVDVMQGKTNSKSVKFSKNGKQGKEDESKEDSNETDRQEKKDKKKKDKKKKDKKKKDKQDKKEKGKPSKYLDVMESAMVPDKEELGEVITYNKPGKRPDKEKFDRKQLKEIGITKQQAARLARYGITLDDMELMSVEQREKWIKMTDGKFNLSGYTPPDEDEPQANNASANGGGGGGNNGGGGSFSSNLKPKPTPATQVQVSIDGSAPNPSPIFFPPSANKPPRTPRPTRRPKPANSNVGDANGDAPNPSPTFFPPSASTPTRSPRPTRQPKPNGSGINALSSSTVDSRWNFVSSLSDTSTQLDGFESSSNLGWSMLSTDPWTVSDTHAYEGRKSLRSGINSNTYALGAEGEAVYSNLTLTTDDSFEGGVLTFMVWARQLRLPSEAFFVSVDGKLELPPSVTAPHSDMENIDGWVEYSVPVGRGKHKVTWSHVYNPFAMESLPPHNGEVGLWMDDLRYAPFSTNSVLDLDELEMTNEADGVDSVRWRVEGDRVFASTSEFSNENDGSANIRLVLHSRKGGMLKYKIKASTTAPNDDFAILLNGKVEDAVFGEMVGFQYKSLEVPAGKQTVTLTHRKNPGKFGRFLLGSLGEVGTEGKTWLEDLSFEAYY